MSLQALKGKSVLPNVSDVIADAESATEGGQFTKIVTKDKTEYFYLTDSEVLIDAKPSDFRVVNSTKHNALFIA